MIQRLNRFALWVTLIGSVLVPVLGASSDASTPGKSVIVGPASSKSGSNALALPGVAAPVTLPLVYIDGSNPEPLVPAHLSPDGELRAKSHALYSEALRIELRQGFRYALPLYMAITKLDPLFIQAHLKIALYYFQHDQVEKALGYLKYGLKYNPDSPELKAATAYAYRLLKRDNEALALAREVLATSPDQVTAYRVVFEIYSEQGKFNEAMKLVEATVKQNTAKASFWINLARLYQNLLDEEYRQNPLRADNKDHLKTVATRLLPLYEKALACGEPSTELLLLLTECHATLDHNDKALEFARQALENSPQNPEVALRVANLELLANHRDEAIKHYEQAYELNPLYGDGWLGSTLSKLYSGTGQTQKAIDVLEQMIGRSPTRVDFYNDVAELYERTERLDKAELSYQQALALDSSSPSPFLRLAYVQIREKKNDAAAAVLLDAQKHFPTSSRICLLQAVNARSQKKYGEALAALEQMRTLSTDDSELIDANFYLELSATQELAGKKELVEATLREGLAKFPNNPNILNGLAYYWAEAKTNLDEALQMSRKSLEAEPTNGAFLDTLGWIYFQQNQAKEAIPYLEQATSITKDDPVVVAHLADAYAKLGRLSDAIELWQKIVQLDPDDKDSKAKLDAALAQASNIKATPSSPKK